MSSRGSSPGGEEAATTRTSASDVAPPPRVPTTARRDVHSRAPTASQRSRGEQVGDSSIPVSLDESTLEHGVHRTSSAASSSHALVSAASSHRVSSPLSGGRRRTRRASSADVLRQRLRNTLEITEAEAVRAARTFSMDMYRELHQRKFKSLHEELDFLRKDFVASRRTLALLHEDNIRLERELLARVRQVEELREELEKAYNGSHEQQAVTVSSMRSSRRASPATSSRRSSAGLREGAAQELTVVWADPPHHHAEGDAINTDTMNARSEKDAASAGASPPPPASASPPALVPTTATAAVAAHAQRTPLSLYAKTTTGKQGSETELGDLVRDLRANLARRDTALDAAQMELAALRNDQQKLQTELQSAQAEVVRTKQQRDEQQRVATAAEEKTAAQEKELDRCRQELQRVTKEKDEVQQRLTTAELLYEHTGAKGDSTFSAAATDQNLRDQLQLYRTKWQAAEDEVEHVHQRLSQLQLQLLRQGARDSAAPPQSARSAAEHDKGSDRLLEVTAQQRAEHATELAELRRQHQEQQALQAEEIQRVQRRLDRALENAAFHEDQLRQQRQEDSRVHTSEVQSLQTQLRTAQAELVKAQQDREHLARQLRRSTEQETTVEVLRGQVEQLKQRLGEVGAELAQVRGREKETQLSTQRERMARAKADHDVEVTQEALQRATKEARYLQEEVALLREQLGMQEASSAAPREEINASLLLSSTDAREESGMRRASRLDRDSVSAGGDAAALASELKGYVSLMRVNTALQRRIEELEAQATQSKMPTPTPAATEAEYKVQVESLRGELERVLRAQRELEASRGEVEREKQGLTADNAILAGGVELLQRRLAKAQAALIAEQAQQQELRHQRRHASRQQCSTEKKKKKRRQVESSAPPSLSGESRVRRRLETARARDQRAVREEDRQDHHTTNVATTEDEEPILARDNSTSCCACRHRCRCCSWPCPPPSSSPLPPPHVGCEYQRDTPSTPPVPPASPAPPPPPVAAAPAAPLPPPPPPAATPPTPLQQLSPTLDATPVSTAAPPLPAPTSTPPPLVDVPATTAVASPTRHDVASSPLHRPRLHVYGSVLPPVHYPTLVLKTRA